jgi:hypothetical protein
MFRRFTGGIRALLHAGWGSAAESVWRDVRYGLRMLARNKGFTTVATFAHCHGLEPVQRPARHQQR